MEEKNGCPYCGERMKSGFLYTKYWILWRKELSKTYIYREGGEKLSKWKRWVGSYIPSLRCHKCGIILIKTP